MSWDQGVQERGTLDPKFRAMLDSLGEKRGWGEVNYITWFGSDPEILFADYGENALKIDFGKLK